MTMQIHGELNGFEADPGAIRAEAHGCTAEIDNERRYPVLVRLELGGSAA